MLANMALRTDAQNGCCNYSIGQKVHCTYYSKFKGPTTKTEQGRMQPSEKKKLYRGTLDNMLNCFFQRATPTQWIDALLLQEAIHDLGVT